MKALWTPVFLLISQTAFSEVKSFAPEKFKELEINTISGAIDVSTHAKKEVLVDYTKKDSANFDKNCSIVFKRTEKKIIVKVGQNKKPGNCEVAFKLTLPENSALEVSSGSSPIQLKGNYSKLDISTGSGNINLDGTAASLSIELGSGNMTLAKIKEKADLRLGSGNVSLDFSEAQDLKIRSGSGNVTLNFDTLRQGAHVDLKMGTGKLFMTSRRNSDKADIDISIGTGDADLKFDKNTILDLSHQSGFGLSMNDLPVSKDSKFDLDINQGSGTLKISKVL